MKTITKITLSFIANLAVFSLGLTSFIVGIVNKYDSFIVIGLLALMITLIGLAFSVTDYIQYKKKNDIIIITPNIIIDNPINIVEEKLKYKDSQDPINIL